MATYAYKPNKRIIYAGNVGGKIVLHELAKFDAKGEYKTTAKAKMDKLDKANGITKKGA